ncbi:MAG TPA: ABC transporter permease, partial [Pseudacidobacterium sp.]|nr:ABC transporter permease [Pseudacidobacterium sp.]
MEAFTGQLKQVLRRLWRAPMFTCITLITLAVGIGANTAVFSVVDGVLLKPLPYPHPKELVGLWHVAPGLNLGGDINMAPSNYFIYREQNRTFRDVGLYGGDSVSVTGAGEPEQVRALDVTDGLLPVLGIAPLLGRTFNAAEVKTGGPDTVILTYGYWQRKFGSDRSVVGRSMTIDGKPHQIVGVMPKGFQFLDWEAPALILPLQFDRNKTTLGMFSYEGIARLKPGATMAEANSDVARMIPTVWESFPTPPGFSAELFKKARLGPNVRPLMRDVVGDVGKLLYILMGSIGMVLLIACANTANLLLVRAEGRQQELAIRSALGASRGRIGGELLLESIVVGLSGGVLGLALAYGALRLLVAIAPAGLPRITDIGINLPVLFFALGVSLLASLLAGCIPVLKYAGARMGTSLREGGRSFSQGRERHRIRNILVVAQVGLAFVLLICAGLMLRTFSALTHVNPGFEPGGVQTLRLTIPEAEVKDDEKVVRMQEAIMSKIAVIQGVSSLGFANSVPMDGGQWHDPVFAQDRNYAEGEMPPLRLFKVVSPGQFHTLGVPLVAGRDFTWAETYERLPVGIVSESFARAYWGSPANALGKRIRVSSKDDWREIVGVAGDVHDEGMNKDAPTIAYWPVLLNRFESDMVHVSRTVVFSVRSPRAGSEGLMKEVRQ